MRSARLRASAAALAALGLAAALTGSAATAPASSALTRKQANAIAIRILRPQADKGEVILFGLLKALPKGAVVEPADPPRGSLGRKVRRRITPLASAAWLYWLDRLPDAIFSHPSEYLLVDARTGRVVRRKAIGWYPTVNGKAPAFLARESAYESARYRVYSRLSRAPARSLTSTAAPSAPPSVVPKTAFKSDCILMVGDYSGFGFTHDFTAVATWAESVGIRAFYTTQNGPTRKAPQKGDPPPSGVELGSNVKSLVGKSGCEDVLIFLDGHGLGEAQGRPTVISSNDVKVESDGVVEHFSVGITVDDVAAAIERHPTIGFKLKINSCFAGRFIEELAPTGKPKFKNLLIAEASSQATEASYFGRDTYDSSGKKKPRADNPNDVSEFVNQNVTGLYAWASSPDEFVASVAVGGSLLANALGRAVELGRPVNAAIRWGAHPVVVTTASGGPADTPASSYSVTDLGLAGGTAASAVDVNGAGQVVGVTRSASGALRAFRGGVGSIVQLTGLSARNTLAAAISQTGVATGVSDTAEGKPRAVVWAAGKVTATVLPQLDGGDTVASGINPQGTIVVGQARSGDGSLHAVCWVSAASGWKLQDAGTVYGQKQGAAFFDINRLETKAGAAYKTPTLFQALTERKGKVTDLGAPNETSIALALNDLGTVAGIKSTLGSSASHAAVWQQGVLKTLDDRGGTSRADDVSNGNLVAGGIRLLGSPSGTAAVWGSGPLVILQERIPKDSGWTLVAAYGVNDQGVIVGTGFIKNQTHAFLLTPTR